MTVLTAGVNASEQVWSVDIAIPTSVKFLRVEDEVVSIGAHSQSRAAVTPDPLKIRVARGVGGTAVSHDSGTTLTPFAPQFGASAIDAGGGGGVTVDNQSDPPAAVTTLIASGADVSTPGEATLPVGVQQVRLLGPYEFSFDTPGIDSGIYLTGIFELTSGTILLDLWLEIVNRWNPGGTPNTTLYVEANDGVDIFDYPGVPISGAEITADTSDVGDVLAANLSTDPAPFFSARTYGEHASGFSRLLPSRVFETAPLYLAVDQNGATAIAGQARIYALIAEPA
jgi:hypothetical protein